MGDTAKENYSRIPQAPFAEDAEELLGKVLELNGDANEECRNKSLAERQRWALGMVDELMSKYRLMESSLRMKQQRMDSALEELESSISAVEKVQTNAKQLMETRFDYELGDTMFGSATIDAECSKVCLWLGAGVLVEYAFDEAIEFLKAKSEDRKQDLKQCSHDLVFVREQITIMEVSMARLYNLGRS